MQGFNESQTGLPLLDYYIETDLDTIDDQPVDYSKKYADQDSEEACVSRNKRHLSASESIDNSKQHDDELKVYCIEGTPLIISSASSMCDLREIGPSRTSETFKPLEEKESCFPDLTEESVTDNNVEVEEKSEEVSEEIENSTEKISEDSSYRNEQLSKASSPLVFSRSSSVGSLNSFDILSIRDDRSSVSAFSTLTSGIISPSDIPDSPGEAMSPFVHKQTFLFPNNSNEKSLDPILDKLKRDPTAQFENTFDDAPEDNVNIYDDEGDFSSVSNFSALTHQTNRTSSSHMSFTVETPSKLEHVSTVKIKYSVKTLEDNASNTCSTNGINILNHDPYQSNQECENSFEDFLTPESVNEQMEKEAGTGDALCSLNLSMEEIDEQLSDEEFFKENSDDEALLEECIKSGMCGASLAAKTSLETQSDPAMQAEDTYSTNLCEVDPTYSDDESDELLDQCILLGKPESKNTSMDFSKSPNVLPVQGPVSHGIQEGSPVQNCIATYCDNDVSDEENDLLADCIQLGMQQSIKPVSDKKGELIFSVLSSTSNGISHSPVNQTLQAESSNHQIFASQYIKGFKGENLRRACSKTLCENDASDDENDLLADCIQLGRPRSVQSDYINNQDLNSEMLSAPKRNCVPQSSQTKPSKPNLSYQQMYPAHCNKYSQNNKKSKSNQPQNISQPLAMGYQRNGINYSVRNGISVSSSSQSFSPLGYRDRIPDGTSDVEDDDMITECIMAGKPGGKAPHAKYLPSPSMKQMPYKPVVQKKPSPRDDRALHLRKPSNLSQRRLFDSEYLCTGRISTPNITEIDSMCVYRTEDTPLLSPTASISDLSTLSFSEDKVGQGCYLNNSRNSDCSSESEDDELLLQCIQSGMPGNQRAVA